MAVPYEYKINKSIVMENFTPVLFCSIKWQLFKVFTNDESNIQCRISV